jgi:hypothetical protein
MDSPAAMIIVLVWDHGMEHLVVDDVLHEPERDEWGIQKRMNPDDPVYLLDRSEDEIRLGT